MRVTRVHVEAALAPGHEVALPEDAAAHLARVLRLREGDACVLFNGDGHDYPARLVSLDKRQVRARIEAAQPLQNESPLRIVLLQGIARGEKMDLILQKATELGVARILPVDSERSEVKLSGERLHKRLAHWQGVVVAACEQSGRARVPEVASPQALIAAAAALPDDTLRLLLDPQGAHALSTLQAPASQRVVIAIGPEGGWSPRDRQALEAAGFQGLRLGPRVLRTETAGLAAIAALQARLGDL
ncbi:16S rRNA (uracil(1498)-N(3))-methyltransferase [Pseudoxanthomonas winnipegensis]|uniref:Ribosomal RNA small subunit methyltransferase E n=1 Tax=Pseudoxanthomonas winnipegensis TaxID=2480810 RepID=A0A4Q8LWT5_9GAMM|nr:16S rRNA (uracil(1498)-N(3))-methyltransferase [Pseudoxanthomonas winnipegensis]RZZ90856.1 16S rRNA (uracil(1498)-N(3))-methyltransferase [Pseudoxanthomonas winnipegensis]TAA36034.1 16S rRNA (uracil(1498)-N(3))-methyltransferase [Pseudoxanthomonas winnipegensis]